jgi:hypothetical protein
VLHISRWKPLPITLKGMTESKYFFLKTKLENQHEKLDAYSFFELIKHKIGWKEYIQLKTEFVYNTYLEGDDDELITELGKNKLNEFKVKFIQSENDEAAERTKLHNESVMSGWKRKTFWYIFALGLFGGIYSGIDLFNKITIKKEVQVEQITKQQMESELTKLRTLILNQKKKDSLNHSNSVLIK